MCDELRERCVIEDDKIFSGSKIVITFDIHSDSSVFVVERVYFYQSSNNILIFHQKLLQSFCLVFPFCKSKSAFWVKNSYCSIFEIHDKIWIKSFGFSKFVFVWNTKKSFRIDTIFEPKLHEFRFFQKFFYKICFLFAIKLQKTRIHHTFFIIALHGIFCKSQRFWNVPSKIFFRMLLFFLEFFLSLWDITIFCLV